MGLIKKNLKFFIRPIEEGYLALSPEQPLTVINQGLKVEKLKAIFQMLTSSYLLQLIGPKRLISI